MEIEKLGRLGPEAFDDGSWHRWADVRKDLLDCQMGVWYQTKAPVHLMTKCIAAMRRWSLAEGVTLNIPRPLVEGETATIRFRIMPFGEGMRANRATYRRPKEVEAC